MGAEMRPELVPEEHTKRWIAKRDRSRNATEPRRLKAAMNGRRARNSEPDRSSIPTCSEREVILSCFAMKESGAQS
jgi:hypothetical protein